MLYILPMFRSYSIFNSHESFHMTRSKITFSTNDLPKFLFPFIPFVKFEFSQANLQNACKNCRCLELNQGPQVC